MVVYTTKGERQTELLFFTIVVQCFTNIIVIIFYLNVEL